MLRKMKNQMMISGSIGMIIPMMRSMMPSRWAIPPNLMSALDNLSIRNGSGSLTTLLVSAGLFMSLLVSITPLTIGILSGLVAFFSV